MVDDLEIEDVIQVGVSVYVSGVLSSGLLWHGFHAICERDGEGLVQYWEFWVVLF